MANKYNFVVEVTAEKDCWRILVRVIRTWMFYLYVMGMLVGVGAERENERNGRMSKMNIIQLEADGAQIECTLLGSFVDKLTAFLASGKVDNVVVIVQFAKVQSFQVSAEVDFLEVTPKKKIEWIKDFKEVII
ncbi:hypothetical protein GmHk_04G010235 [Glycine max]|nr:hypothetical protein GmHk_04G010235 [Glycine max]